MHAGFRGIRSFVVRKKSRCKLILAINAGHLKTGSGCRSKRIEKFNQLMRIEKQLGGAANFEGIKAFKNR